MAAKRAIADTGDDGERLFLSELATINRAIAWICARNHVPYEDAEEFGSHVRLKLIEDNYAIIRKFQGRSALRTYLTVVIQRLFLDYRISAWGKWRPSAEAKRGGSIATLLEQLLVRDGHTLNEACELLKAKYRVALTRAELEALADRLPVHVKRRMDPEDVLLEIASPGSAADQNLIDAEHQTMADRVSRILAQVTGELGTQDRLILALRFVDGHSVADIAKLLRLDQKPLYPRVSRILERLRAAFVAAGIDASAVAEMLESATVSVEWTPDTGNSEVRPSTSEGAQEWP